PVNLTAICYGLRFRRRIAEAGEGDANFVVADAVAEGVLERLEAVHAVLLGGGADATEHSVAQPGRMIRDAVQGDRIDQVFADRRTGPADGLADLVNRLALQEQLNRLPLRAAGGWRKFRRLLFGSSRRIEDILVECVLVAIVGDGSQELAAI